MKYIILFILMGMFANAGLCAGPLSESVLPPEILGQDELGAQVTSRSMMFRWMLPQVLQAEQKWIQDYEKAKTPEQIAEYQRVRKEFFLRSIGGLPERTPLNARTTGVIQRDGYRIELVLFESQPGLLVSANLYLPDKSKFPGPRPGILFSCGHNDNGKAAARQQQCLVLHALNGFAGLNFDPIDQGERFQLVDREAKKRLAVGTHGHNLIGIGSILLGRNTARFEIWDGMRGIDYLQSRPEVDKNSIGAAGLSGGGTQTAYLMALDERISAAASMCYLTTLNKMLKMNKPQDAEQNIFGQAEFGLEHADYCILRAPKPTMIGCATKDFFPIEETWQTYRYSKRIFELLGYGERMNLSEAYEQHGLYLGLRQATVRFMLRFLTDYKEKVTGPDAHEPVFEPKVDFALPDKDVQVTESGFTIMEPGSRTTFDLNRDFARELAARRPDIQKKLGQEGLKARVRELAKIRPLSEIPELTVQSRAEIKGTAAEKIVFKVENGLFLPAVWFNNHGQPAGKQKAVLYINDKGKSAGEKDIDKLMSEGRSVLAVDLRGYGETQQIKQMYFKEENFGPDGQDFYTAYHLGKTYVGWRAEDVLNLARWLKSQTGIGPVECFAVGEATIPALHALFVEPAVMDFLTVEQTLISWSNVVENGGISRTPLTSIVHAALTVYDLPDLRAALESAGKLKVGRMIDTKESGILEKSVK